jgi:drug/metabolite transporter (DMT)-like permease
MWGRGVAEIGPARAGVYLHLIPLFGALMAVTLLGESLHLYHVVGIALILLGIRWVG